MKQAGRVVGETMGTLARNGSLTFNALFYMPILKQATVS